MNKEGNDFSIEGGALILTNKSLCFIDELDKMTGD